MKARLILLIALAVGFVSPVQSDHKAYTDEMVRAAVIFGILRFAEWDGQQPTEDHLELCAYGESPSVSAIQTIAKLPKAGSAELNFIPDAEQSNFADCDALILGDHRKPIDTPPSGVLLICDECSEQFRPRAAISLMQEDSRIQFEINLDQVRAQQINLSASLIELAASCSSSDPQIRGCDD